MRMGMWAFALTLGIAGFAAGAQADTEATGVWKLDSGKVTVRVSPCGGNLCGIVIALKKPRDDKGRPRLDKENPEECIIRETQEETGYKISSVQKIFEAYMSPGSVTEILYFFIAAYSKEMKVDEGGGAEHEEENIEVLEILMEDVMKMIADGRIKDAKTIMLIQHLRLHNIL